MPNKTKKKTQHKKGIGKIIKKVAPKKTKGIVAKIITDRSLLLQKPNLNDVRRTKVRVVGIGGGGSSIVSELASRVKKATFVVANTDSQALKSSSRKAVRFQFGQSLTKGLGTGMKGDIAELASQNERDKIKKLLADQDLCIFVACLGGGTGSGAVPNFAKIARSLGSISYGIFTMPFKFEGEKKMQMAIEAIEKLKPNLNAISIIPNDRIFQIVGRDTPLKSALSAVNKHLADSLEALLETIYSPGLINIDFADLRTVFEGRGRLTYLNTVELPMADRSEELVKQILHSPLYPYTIKGAKGILFNIANGKDLELSEVSEISNIVSDAVNRQAKIIMGISHNRLNTSDQKDGKVRVTLLATGCGQRLFADQPLKPKVIKKKRPKKKIVEPKIVKKTEKVKKQKPKEIIKAKNTPPATYRPSSSGDVLVRPSEQEKVEVKVRRSGLEIQKDIQEEEKEIISQENKWELPAFLRRKNNDQN